MRPRPAHPRCAACAPDHAQRDTGRLPGLGLRHPQPCRAIAARCKERHAVATRYEKAAVGFTGLLCHAATIDAIE